MPIHVLPDDIVNKIAAGEVIERPSSVVKELLENSIDAGARTIAVEIAGGGTRAIRVADDGCGIGRDELALALRRHATSKIGSYEDVLGIASYGFRGEALPSIAAVSRLSITSRTAGSATAWSIQCQDGRCGEPRAAAANAGTSIAVEELFAAVPARRKFLKSEQTEARRIIDEVTAQALANPGLAISLAADGRETLRYRPGSRAERAAEVLGNELFATLVAFDHGQRPVRAFGFASKPEHLWPRRREQLVFVNGRRVSDRLVHAAVYQAYGPALQGRHPAYLVFVDIAPRDVDVNVHPAKSQVRFRDESLVFNTVRAAINRALFSDAGAVLGQEPSAAAPGYQPRPAPAAGQVEAALQSVRELFAEPYGPAAPLPAAEAAQPVVAYWQAHHSYILAETKTGIIVIDQHAAHERILYEDLLRSRGARQAQQLLFPLNLELSLAELEVFEQYRPVFEGLGFDIKRFSGRTVVVEGLPAEAGVEADGAAIIRGILADLAETAATAEEPAARVARSFACRAAVKAGQPLTAAEMGRLVDRLFASSSPYLDPHGRPSVIKLSLDDLDRRFGRS